MWDTLIAFRKHWGNAWSKKYATEQEKINPKERFLPWWVNAWMEELKEEKRPIQNGVNWSNVSIYVVFPCNERSIMKIIYNHRLNINYKYINKVSLKRDLSALRITFWWSTCFWKKVNWPEYFHLTSTLCFLWQGQTVLALLQLVKEFWSIWRIFTGILRTSCFLQITLFRCKGLISSWCRLLQDCW